MVMLDILNSLSFSGAERLLQQEGYTPGECIERADAAYDRVFQYPYFLYDSNNCLIDTVYLLEYCYEVVDDEYTDGRMTWETEFIEWKRR